MNNITKGKKILFGALIVLILIGIGVTTFIVQKRQDTRQRASGFDKILFGVAGKADLTFTPQELVAKTGQHYELDLVVGQPANARGTVTGLAFTLNLPPGKISNVVFVPSPTLEILITNSISSDGTKLTYAGVDINEKLNQPYVINTWTKATTPMYLGRLKFTASADFAGQLTFANGEVGFDPGNLIVYPLVSRSSTNSLSLHPTKLTINSTAGTVGNKIIDAQPAVMNEYGPLDRVLVVRSFRHDVGIGGLSYRTLGDEFTDANSNGVYDIGEDYAGASTGTPYNQREQLMGGASFTLNSTFVANQPTDTKNITTDANGYAIVTGFVGDPGTWVSYTMTNLAGPAGYITSFIYPNFAFFPGQINFNNIAMIPPVSVNGTTFIDKDNNNQFNGNDEPAPNVTLNITNITTLVGKSVTSDVNGRYSMGGLEPNAGYDINVQSDSTYQAGVRKSFQANSLVVSLDIPVTLKPATNPSITPQPLNPPTISSFSVTGITATAATLLWSGDAHGVGVTSVVFRFVQGISSATSCSQLPNILNYNLTTVFTGQFNGATPLTGLTASTTYAYCAVITNRDGTAYSNIRTFSTLALNAPTPTTTFCKTGADSFSVNTDCGTNLFRNMTYTCYDGYSGTEGGSSSCKTRELWLTYAINNCAGRTSCSPQYQPPTATPGGPTPKPLGSPCTTDEECASNKCAPVSTQPRVCIPYLSPNPSTAICPDKNRGDFTCEGFINLADLTRWIKERDKVLTTLTSDITAPLGTIDILDLTPWVESYQTGYKSGGGAYIP